MTVYTSVQLVQQRLVGLSSLGSLADDVLETYIRHAEGYVNGQLANRYTVPLSPTPPLVESVASDITAYLLITRRLFTGKQTESAAEWANRYKEAYDTLRDIADGTLLLTTASGTLLTQSASPDVYWSNTENYQPTFHEGHEFDQVQDPDKLDDLAADRGW